MLRYSALALAVVAEAEAFSPGPSPFLLRARSAPRTLSTGAKTLKMQRSGKPIDRKDGFGGGFEAIKKKLEERR